MGRPTRADQSAYMRTYRADPLAADVNRWYSRTRNQALKLLARRHRAEYLAVLYEVRVRDPKPAAKEEECHAA